MSVTEGFNLNDAIRKVPDFPKSGILFYDITSVLTNPDAFRYCIHTMVKLYQNKKIDAVAAIESRGFIFAAPLCDRLGIPLILVRKKGKLPGKTISRKYDLEYGQAEIEMHEADLPTDADILIVDDLIATGGTVVAAAELIKSAGSRVVGVFAAIGLPFLDYQDRLGEIKVDTLIEYFGE